jgi:hypothetical protein
LDEAKGELEALKDNQSKELEDLRTREGYLKTLNKVN